MAPLAEPALDVVRDGTIKFFPERHAQQYLSWLGEKRDWPISRQLWWGHRIPVWTAPSIAPDDVDQAFSHYVEEGRAAIQFLGEGPYAVPAICFLNEEDKELQSHLESFGFTQD